MVSTQSGCRCLLRESVQFSQSTCSVVSNSLQPDGLQHTRPSCPSPTPGVYSDSCPLSRQVMPFNHLILCHPLLPPSIFPSIRVFSNVSSSHQVARVLGFQLQHQLFNEYSGLISFRMDWLDLLAVQGTRKCLLQQHSSEASILQCTAFFIVQLSHPYMTTGKTIALTRQTFVGRVMTLLFNMLSRLVITSFPRIKSLLISWLQTPSAVIFGAPQNKICHCLHCFPIYLP